MNRRVLVFAPALAALWGLTAVGGQAALAQDAAGVILGRVVAADSGVPLAAAQVTLETVSLAGAAQPGVFSRSATTDADGAFELAGLRAGRYLVSAAKAGFFLPASMGRPRGGVVITVSETNPVGTLALAMLPGGAITGRVVDEFGDPLAEVRVHAVRRGGSAAGVISLSMLSGASDVTDDRGHFRVYGLPAGDFLLVATQKDDSVPLLGTAVGFRAPVGARLQVAPTYYPGTPNPADADTIPLGLGEEASLQLTLLRVASRAVSGIALQADGNPAAGFAVSLRSIVSSPLYVTVLASISATGEFAIPNVPPGEYRLDLSRSNGASPLDEWASMRVSVGDEDVAGLRLVASPASIIRGTVEFDGELSEYFQLNASPVDSDTSGRGASSKRVGEDRQFELRGVVGRVLFGAISRSWMVTSVIVDGLEMVDEPLDLAGRSLVEGVRVTVTDRLPSIFGRVIDDRGRAVKDRLVILLRTNAAAAAADAVRTLRTDDNGEFNIRGLRPGSYVVGAIDTLEPVQVSSEFQDRLRALGRRFSLAQGEGLALELTPTRGL